MAKKVLVLGATGAMGQYLVPLLADKGYQIDAVSLEETVSEYPNVRTIAGDAKEWEFLNSLLKNHYDGIVDFMIYDTSEAVNYLTWIAPQTDHYIYFSTYRIYDNKQIPVTENAPRLLDTADDIYLRNSNDYSVYKARGENIMHAMPRKNWTIVRPAITYSFMRYQLVTLELHNTVGRAFQGKTVVVPEEARNVQSTMSWAGDVAEMLAAILFNDKALGETYNICTAEHQTWEQVAEYYKDICNMKTLWVPREDYLNIICPWKYAHWAEYQLNYDRLFERVMDNSKILSLMGKKQSDLRPLYDGLKYEVSRCPKDFQWNTHVRMDEYLAERGMK